MGDHGAMKLWAKKSLGQHFLNSRHVLGQIITAGDIKHSEYVLEIGPGTGILTEALLQAGARVIAVEKDHRSIDILKEKFTNAISSGDLQLLEGDILEMDTGNVMLNSNKDQKEDPTSVILDSCLRRNDNSEDRDDTKKSSGEKVELPPYSLIANIPYYITGAILEKFLEYEPRPTKMVLLVQREVAERIVARPQQSSGKSKESILSISVKAFGTPRIVARVAPGAFTPPPTVESAILSIEHITGSRFETPQGPISISHFFNIVRAGFAHKRKYIKRNLEAVMLPEKIDTIWQTLSLNDKIRAEDMTLEQWVSIAEHEG
jgi:16S rRNA (adenine1518-N6/adenine1519-N6)-dimethyltransferase